MHRSLPASGIATVVALLALGGCAVPASVQPTVHPSPPADTSTPDPSGPDGTTELGAVPEPLPTGEVLGLGLVLDAGTPILCLGDVGASLPPTCGGEPLVGWDWSSIDGWESRASTRWGSYAVQGTWDGASLTVTAEPIALALFDPAPVESPAPTPCEASVDELQHIQQVVLSALGDRVLGVGIVDGCVEARVVYDDGTVQQHLEATYGRGIVRVVSALGDAAT